MANVFAARFVDLDKQAERVLASAQPRRDEVFQGHLDITAEDLLQWTQKVQHLLDQVAGVGSQYSSAFREAAAPGGWTLGLERFNRGRAVFRAAKEDFEFGMFRSFRNLVQAEVFSAELDQATELLSAGYSAPAAVTAGVVLETTIRQMCTANGIPHDRRTKLERMNEDLVKKGVYNSLVQKRVTALAAIRNAAAHGNYHEYTDSEVRGMISDIESFVAERLP